MTTHIGACMSNFHISGYTTKQHLLLDIDEQPLSRVVKLADMLQKEYPQLGDYIILKSSIESYHIVYGSFVPWKLIINIIDMLWQLGIIEKEVRDVREFRGDLTLRISPRTLTTGEQPTPEIVHTSIQDPLSEERVKGIRHYLMQLVTFY